VRTSPPMPGRRAPCDLGNVGCVRGDIRRSDGSSLRLHTRWTTVRTGVLAEATNVGSSLVAQLDRHRAFGEWLLRLGAFDGRAS
jgi:hypothetical protein